MATLTMYEVEGTKKVNAIGYTAKSKELSIEFKSGKMYTFYDVPKSVFTDMQNADNADTFFLKSVKGQYDYAVEDTEAEEAPAPKKPAGKKPGRKPTVESGTREPAEHQSGVKGINWHKVLGRWVVYYRDRANGVEVRVGSYALNELKQAKADLAAAEAEYTKPQRKAKAKAK